MASSKNNKRKNDTILLNSEQEEPAPKSSKKQPEIKSMKKNDIILQYEELKKKYEHIVEENHKLHLENLEYEDAISRLEEKAEKLQYRVQTLLKRDNLAATDPDKEDKGKDNNNPSCEECGYQASNLVDLGSHVFEFHRQEYWNETFNCSFCDLSYPCKEDLMIHRKKKHTEKVPLCRHLSEGHCHFKNCWYRHEEIRNASSDITCGFCGKKFKNKTDLMKHVKMKHQTMVRKCKDFKEGNCFYKERCWYDHSD